MHKGVIHKKKNKTHAYSALRSSSKKYQKVERRKRNKPRWCLHISFLNTRVSIGLDSIDQTVKFASVHAQGGDGAYVYVFCEDAHN